MTGIVHSCGSDSVNGKPEAQSARLTRGFKWHVAEVCCCVALRNSGLVLAALSRTFAIENPSARMRTFAASAKLGEA